MSYSWRLFFVISFIVLGQFAVGVYVPAMPAIGDSFNAVPSTVQNTLTVYLSGFACFQLLYGPISDYIGRRHTAMAGLGCFTVGTCITASSTNIYIFMLGRFIEGVGAAGGSVIGRAIMRDVFSGHYFTQVNAYLAIFWAIFFLGSPFIGGTVQKIFGWRGDFVLLAVLGLTLFMFSWLILQETLEKERRRKRGFGAMLANYRELLQSRTFVGYVLCLFVLYGVFMAINAVTPYLLQTRLQHSAFMYGVIMMLMSSGYMVGAFITSRLVSNKPVSQLIQYGFILMLAIALLMVVLTHTGMTNTTIIALPVFMFLVAMGLVYPNCMAQCLAPFSHIAGSAGALFGFLLFSGGMVASKISAMLPEETALPMALILLVQAVLAFTLYLAFFGVGKETTYE